MDVLNHKQIELKIQRMACEIAECYVNQDELILCGLNERGMALVKMLGIELKELAPSLNQIKVQVMAADSLEWKNKIDCKDKHVLLVDDVINSGRTLMQLLAEVFEHKPRSIRTAFLAKREHRMYPVKADFVGLSIATTLKEHVYFDNENVKNMRVYLK